jgi:hypothetical protein
MIALHARTKKDAAHTFLLQDAFGAGMRLTTKYAYKAGSVCAWMRYPDPRSGTIVGLYLIDVHPKGECVRSPWLDDCILGCKE